MTAKEIKALIKYAKEKGVEELEVEGLKIKFFSNKKPPEIKSISLKREK